MLPPSVQVERQRAVRARVDDRVGAEHVPDPPVAGEVLVGHHEVVGMYQRFDLLEESPGGPYPDEDVSVDDSRNAELPVGSEQLAGYIEGQEPCRVIKDADGERKGKEPAPWLLAPCCDHAGNDDDLPPRSGSGPAAKRSGCP